MPLLRTWRRLPERELHTFDTVAIISFLAVLYGTEMLRFVNQATFWGIT